MSEKEDQRDAEKIIVDEDWKAQVQAEKEAAQRAAAQPAPGAKTRAKGPLPPPSLPLLASSLGMQATIAMGLVPNPIDGKTGLDLEQAKHLIDTIDMLCEKTQGNRTADETAMLEDLLHELRLGYVTVSERGESGKPRGGSQGTGE